jgi:cold shock CspA family protein
MLQTIVIAAQGSTRSLVGRGFPIRCLSSSESPQHLTGKVTFYNRAKAYGFVIPDGVEQKVNPDGSMEGQVYVHRTGIVSDLSVEESSMYPFLRAGERIRFTVSHTTPSYNDNKEIPQDAVGKPRAVQVTWLDGTPIPPLRPNYLISVQGTSVQQLGLEILEYVEQLNDDDSATATIDPEEQLKALYAIVKKAQTNINGAKQKIVKLGMKVEDFPVLTKDSNWRLPNMPRKKGTSFESSSNASTTTTDSD